MAKGGAHPGFGTGCHTGTVPGSTLKRLRVLLVRKCPGIPNMMSRVESDHLLPVRAESSTQCEENTLSDPSTTRCCRVCRALPLLVILACASNGVPTGFVFSTSYFISPVRKACSPPWSKSATVYGSSAMAAGWMTGPFLAFFMHKTHLRLYFLINALCYSLIMGIAGAMVMSCHQAMLTGEMIYIGMFTMYGINNVVLFIANTEFPISWMPQWPGFAGGIHGLSVSVGSVIIPQIIIWLRDWFSSSHINVGTIFFCLGIFKLILSIPWLPIVNLPHTDKRPDSSQSSSSRKELVRQLFRNYRLWFVSFACLAAYLPTTAIMAVQEPLLLTLWHEPNAPISTLAFILMGCFLAGRVLCLVFSDKIGLKLIWFLALLSQAIFLLCLGFLVIEPMGNSLKSLRFAVLCLFLIIISVLKSTMAGLSHDTFGDEYRLVATGVMSFVYGIAGIIGPVAIDAIHTHFNNYATFFFGSAILSVMGALALLAVQLPGTRHVPVSSIQDRASEDMVDR